MGKRLQGNGIYVSSRFIIPQHREAAVRQMQEINRRVKPNLDEQQWEMVAQALSESIREHMPVTIHVFGAFENQEVTGMVISVNTFRKKVKLSFDDDWEWIRFEDIIAAEV
ncbi:YolD-like family protein [Paenibacillus macquariensis]|uniref:YolD-like protein n=1 Tax=Paenibacillus macquariensis TaxID=948756 RepID=A0ABY1KDL3_9BACL|nr:YolD-like family protein [Paenibacillus macquariensis]OAB27362.1 hypothetical protein PMSM_25450 [Paenibacillus macquariensis subsp. macquariensis]SIR66168.1 YolD-like protein [Paenibacillus macquariensis]